MMAFTHLYSRHMNCTTEASKEQVIVFLFLPYPIVIVNSEFTNELFAPFLMTSGKSKIKSSQIFAFY